MTADRKKLESLLQLDSGSGDEATYARHLYGALQQTGLFQDIRLDRMNNVIACTGNKKRQLLLEAHFDEISLIVCGIDPTGFIRVQSVGGTDRRCFPSSEVFVNGLPGIFCSVPPHLAKSGEKDRIPTLQDMYIDLGLNCDTVRQKVHIGDRVRLNAGVSRLLDGRLAAKALDNKAGVYTVFAALEMLSDKILTDALGCDISVLFSAQEEPGCRGAVVGAHSLRPDTAICIDMTFAAQPGVEDCPELGSGVVIERSAFFDKNLTRRLMTIADKCKIPHTVNVQSGRSGTDGDVVGLHCAGVPTAVLSVPIRNMHTPVEVCDMTDIESAAKLICAYAKEAF